MNDLISRQEAITEIQKAYMDTQEGYYSTAVKINVGLAKALHIVQVLPAAETDLSGYSDRLWKAAYERGKEEGRAEQRWIPCSERLPEEKTKCLVTNIKQSGALETDWNVLIKGSWLFSNPKPVAWMPLPKPYRENAE